jgi:hypothetical protein
LETRIPAGLTSAEGRRFGLTLGVAFVVLSLVLWWRDHDAARTVTGVLALLFILGGLLVPSRMAPVFRVWMRLGLAISRVTTPIFMGIIFFLVITPVGVVARVLGHRPLVHEGRATFWRVRREGDRKSNLERQF